MTAPLLALAPGTLVEALGDHWAAYSALSGESLLLNDSAAAVLEVVGAGAVDDDSIAAMLADDSGQPLDELKAMLQGVTDQLLSAGLLVSAAETPGTNGILAE